MESLLASVHVGNLQRFCQLCCKSKFRLHFLQGRWGGGIFLLCNFLFSRVDRPSPQYSTNIWKMTDDVSILSPPRKPVQKILSKKNIYIFFFIFIYNIRHTIPKIPWELLFNVQYIVCALCSTKVVLFWYFSQNDDLLWIIPRFWNTWGDGWDLEKCNHSFLF